MLTFGSFYYSLLRLSVTVLNLVKVSNYFSKRVREVYCSSLDNQIFYSMLSLHVSFKFVTVCAFYLCFFVMFRL